MSKGYGRGWNGVLCRDSGSEAMKRLVTVFTAVAVVLVLSAGAFAQKALPKYDLKTEITLKKAIVQDVKEVTLPNGQNRFRLIVTEGGNTWEVCLCPKAFMEMLDTSFAKGDEVEVTGSKVQDGENTLILAREVVKGQNTLVLRDKKGEPVWSWMEKKGNAEGK
jgi:hypothetical protein